MRQEQFLLAILVTLIASGCTTQVNDTTDGTGLPNPSAVYCEELGYTYEVRGEELGETGYCVFPDGSECPGWEFYRGECVYCPTSATGFPPAGALTILSNEFLVSKGGSAQIIVRNNAAADITTESITIDTYTNETETTVTKGGYIMLFIGEGGLTPGTEGGCYSFDVEIDYNIEHLTSMMTVTGTIAGKYQ